MNQIKCPKCGEMNPAEAVMCWACYTPLSGAAVAGAGGGTAAVATPAVVASDETEKKPIQPWQMGVVGVGLLLVLGIGAKTMMGGGTDESLVETAVPAGYPSGGTNVTQSSGVPKPNEAIPPSPAAPGGVPAVQPAKFLMVAPPNPDSAWSIIGIVPAEANVAPQRAAAIARFAKTLTGTNKPTQVYVFADREAGQTFSRFQLQRRSEILTPGDYTQLAELWPRCLARYEYNGGKERVVYPSNNPNNWWDRRA